jgi:carbon storage regulator
MLVLTRRIGEEILIAGSIRVAVVAVKGKQVRLGITAPSSIPVARRELLDECSEGAGETDVGCPPLQVDSEEKNQTR